MAMKFINKNFFLCHNSEFKLGNFKYEFSYFLVTFLPHVKDKKF